MAERWVELTGGPPAPCWVDLLWLFRGLVGAGVLLAAPDWFLLRGMGRSVLLFLTLTSPSTKEASMS